MATGHDMKPRKFNQKKGVTLVEIVIVVAIVGILASAFSSVMVPTMNFLYYFPQSSRVNAAGADLLQIITEGDDKAEGLRFAGPPCAIGGAGGGGARITEASTSGSTSTLTYNYALADYCGSSAARIAKTVTLTYDSSLGTVTRSVDGGTAYNIPYYVTSGSDINFSVSGGGTDLFHYFNSSGTDLGTTPLPTTITHVQSVGTNFSQAFDTTMSVTVPVAGVTAGNLLVVYFAMDDVDGAVVVNDTQGNSYKVAAESRSAGNVRTLILYSHVKTALVSGNTIRITSPRPQQAATATSSKAVSISEFSGADTYEAQAVATGSSTGPSSGNATTTVPDSLLVGAIGVEGPSTDSFTAGGSYSTAPPTRTGTNNGGAADTNISINPEYQVVSTAGARAADGTLGTSRDWAAAQATFYGTNIARVDIDVIASSGSGQVKHTAGQIRLETGVEIKQFTT